MLKQLDFPEQSDAMKVTRWERFKRSSQCFGRKLGTRSGKQKACSAM